MRKSLILAAAATVLLSCNQNQHMSTITPAQEPHPFDKIETFFNTYLK